jgi:1-acyl-sn-glycerol-3-phosphate acyltransferase
MKLLVTRPQSRVARAAWLHEFSSAALAGMQIRYTLEGAFPARGAVISNHQGYADIIVFAALHPVVFCSKAEIRRWPVLGWMTTMAGTVYVERGRGGSALKAAAGMKAAAEAGLPVVFFPEGTTSNGEQVLPFHSGLLAQALAAQEPITAACVHYTLDEPNAPGVTVADNVNYWGDVNLLAHIFKFLSLRGIHAHVRFAPGPIAFSSDALHRKHAAMEARDAVLALR